MYCRLASAQCEVIKPSVEQGCVWACVHAHVCVCVHACVCMHVCEREYLCFMHACYNVHVGGGGGENLRCAGILTKRQTHMNECFDVVYRSLQPFIL